MSYFRKIMKYIFNSNYRFQVNSNLGFNNRMTDENYIKRLYFAKTNEQLNLNDPKLFNEKLQWLKLNNRKTEYTEMVDKQLAKEYVTRIIGEGHVAKTLAVYCKIDEIDYSVLPEKFVMKSTHGCGGMYIHKGGMIDKHRVKKVFDSLKKNYYYRTREWPYKNVKPRVIVEEYLENGDEDILTVYKVFNFHGNPYIIQVIQDDKTPEESIDYFDTNWNLLELKQNYPNSKKHLPRPKTLDEMLDYSKRCSYGIPFLRTDWYEVNGKVYFSEFTFFSDAGMEPFYPSDWNIKLGDLIDLTEVNPY